MLAARCRSPSALAVAALVQLAGSRAAVTNATIGDWSAPVAWPIVAVHMSLEPTGQVFMLDGFDDAYELGAPLGSGHGSVHPRALRTKPVLRRPHSARRRPHAHRRRSHQRQRRPRRYDDLQSDDEHVLPRARHVRRTLVSDGDAAARRPGSHVCRRQHRPGSPRRRSAVLRRVRRLAPVGLQPDDEHVDRPTGREVDVAALPLHVRALGRPDLRRRAGQDDAHPEPRHVDLVDRSGRARSTVTARSCTGRTRS